METQGESDKNNKSLWSEGVARDGAKRDLSLLTDLNVGCGPLRLNDAVGIDSDPLSAADVFWDLDNYPWPFNDSRFNKVTLSHVIEHLQYPDRAVREAHRVCNAKGKIIIVTPHFSSYQSYGDITHRWHFGATMFTPYCRGKNPLFRLLNRRLEFGSSPLCWPGRLVSGISMDLYEKYFTFILPGRNMEFILETIK